VVAGSHWLATCTVMARTHLMQLANTLRRVAITTQHHTVTSCFRKQDVRTCLDMCSSDYIHAKRVVSRQHQHLLFLSRPSESTQVPCILVRTVQFRRQQLNSSQACRHVTTSVLSWCGCTGCQYTLPPSRSSGTHGAHYSNSRFPS